MNDKPHIAMFTLIDVDEAAIASMEKATLHALHNNYPLLIIADSPDAEELVKTAPFMEGPLAPGTGIDWLKSNKGRFAVAWT